MKKWLTIFISMFTTNRAKAFYWSSGMMILAFVFKTIADSAPSVPDMPGWVAVVSGLIYAQISKHLNNKYGLKK